MRTDSQSSAAPPSAPFADTVYTNELLERRSRRYHGMTAEQLLFGLAAWYSGLISFLDIHDRALAEPEKPQTVARDRRTEFLLVHAGVTRIAELIDHIRSADLAPVEAQLPGIEAEIRELSGVAAEYALLLPGLTKGRPGFAEWRSFREMLGHRLTGLSIADSFDRSLSRSGLEFLPERFRSLTSDNSLSAIELAAVTSVAERLGRVMGTLRIIGDMLKADEPLKAGVLIFCGIYVQMRSLIDHINNLLTRFPDDQTEVFGLLDGTSYIASLELKKAYFQELTGIVALRPAPAIYARFETAYSLLNDSMRQMVTSFAKLFDPEIDSAALFPVFNEKLEQSLKLRASLAQVLKTVQAAEKKPDAAEMKALDAGLGEFLNDNIPALYYKDRESFRRFSEQIDTADDKKDLVPILHRFAAYLETLLRQVNMRSVLAGHPFEEGPIRPDPDMN
jgi:hypothetical protein